MPESSANAPEQGQQPELNRKNNWGRGPLFFYVPDEVHILLDEPHPHPGRNPDDAQMWRRHDALSQAFNDRLSEVAEREDYFSEAAIEQRIQDRMETLPQGQHDREPPDMSKLPQELRTALLRDLAPHPDTVQALKVLSHPVQPFHPPLAEERRADHSWFILPNAAIGTGVLDDFAIASRMVAPGDNGGNGPRLRSLHFFQVGSHRLHTAARGVMDAIFEESGDVLSKQDAVALVTAEAGKRARHVRDLVNAVNLHPNLLDGHPAMAKFTPHAITAIPNWLCDASCGGCNCPGSPPQPIPRERLRDEKGYWSFNFTKDDLRELVENQRNNEDTSDVVVAVLDTSPTSEEVRLAAERPVFSNNALLQRVRDKITIDAAADGSLPREAFTPLEGITVDWRQLGEPSVCKTADDRLKMNDHGLFIAGIVHDIAPRADVHLIRVLGEYGVTHTSLILPVLRALPRHFLEGNDKKLIINMSLGWSIPPGAELLRTWHSETFGQIKALLTEHEDLDTALATLESNGQAAVARTVAAILDHLHAPIREMMAFLTEGKYKDRILIVASAGNDNGWFDRRLHRERHRPEPRWPARYEKVVGVAAVGFNDKNAHYSNRADISTRNNGVATFGGEAIREGDRNHNLGVIDTFPSGLAGPYGSKLPETEVDEKVDAVKGIYITDPVMLDGGPNETGWVYWSGTSFATPVITGLAANIWADRMERGEANRPDDIIAAITSARYDTVTREEEIEKDRADALDCPKIEAEQVWKAVI